MTSYFSMSPTKATASPSAPAALGGAAASQSPVPVARDTQLPSPTWQAEAEPQGQKRKHAEFASSSSLNAAADSPEGLPATKASRTVTDTEPPVNVKAVLLQAKSCKQAGELVLALEMYRQAATLMPNKPKLKAIIAELEAELNTASEPTHT